MKGMTLDAMAKACHGKLMGANSMQYLRAAGIVIDSRKVHEGYVFVALKGERSDGHDFIPQVFAENALAVISERKLCITGKPYILVKSTHQALKDLAAFYRSVLDLKTIGISGSVGKTSTKEMIASVLAQKYRVHKTEGNFNNEIGLPLTVFKMTEEHQAAVLEMGISEFDEMHRLAAIARPDIAVITNIGLCHLETLADRDGILKAKTEMFDHLQEDATVILNGDDDKLCTIAQVQGKQPIFYGIGTQKPSAAAYDAKAIYATDIQNLGLRGIQLQIHTEKETFPAHIPIPGEHNVYNALAATAVGLTLGLGTEEIKAGLKQVKMIDGRTNLIETNGKIVIDDCYNANPVSMKAALDVLATADGRTIAVLGDMNELGEDKEALHYDVGTYLADKGIDILFCTGTLCHELANAVREHSSTCEVHEFASKHALLKELLPFLQEGDAILIKASHFMEFSEIVEVIITT